MSLACLIGICLLQIFCKLQIPESILIYASLLVFSAFVLYDVQKLIDNAKKKETWDPIDESLDIYLDAIAIF